jgi:hypothetical protein
MQPCNRICYYTVNQRLNMFRTAQRSPSGALTVFSASGLHTYVQIQLELLIMSGLPLETCWVFDERWSNKFYYKVGYFSWVILRCTNPWILTLYESFLAKQCDKICLQLNVTSDTSACLHQHAVSIQSHVHTHGYAKPKDTSGYKITTIWNITPPNVLHNLACGAFLFSCTPSPKPPS